MGGIQCCEQERPKPKINLDAKIGLYEFAFPNGYEDRQTIDYFVKNWDLKEAQEKTIENKNKDLRQRSTVKKKLDPNANNNANKPSNNKGDNSRGSKSNSGSHDNAYLGAGNKYLTDKRSSGNGDKDELQSQGSRSIGSRGGSSNARTGKEGNRLRARLSGVLQQKLRGSFTNLNKNLDLPFDQKRQSSYVKKTSPIVAKEIKKNSQQMEKSKFDNKLDDYLDQEEEEFKLNEDLDSADNNGANHAAADDSDLDDDKLHLPLKVQDLNLQPINYRKLANSKQQQNDNDSGDQHLGVQNTKPSYSNPIGVPNGFLKAFTLRNNGNALNGNLKNTSNTIQSDNQREIDRYNNNMDKMDTLKEADSHEEEASKQYSGIIRVTKLE